MYYTLKTEFEDFVKSINKRTLKILNNIIKNWWCLVEVDVEV
jgi:predicted transcriptional regulator